MWKMREEMGRRGKGGDGTNPPSLIVHSHSE